MKSGFNKFAAIYYLLLLVILVSWRSVDVAPPLLMRLAFMVAMFLPALIKFQDWMVPVTVCFTCISRYSYYFSYLPYEISYIAFVALVCYIFNNRTKPMVSKLNTPKTLIFLAFYTIAVDLINGWSILPISYSVIIVLCLIPYIDISAEKTVHYISMGFCVASTVLSILFLTTREQLAVRYGNWSEGLERSGWTDPNYFGMALGMGAVCAGILLFRNHKSLATNIVCVVTLAISLMASSLNASRGALLAMFVALGVLLMLSKIKLRYKVLSVLSALGFLIYLFNNDYFALLEYRIQEDSGDGSGRFGIWAAKLEAYFREGDFTNILFGYGGDYGANKLAIGNAGGTTGSHNDYVAFFVNYGPIGFVLLLAILFKPIISYFKRGRTNIPLLVSSLYLVLCCLTLEPLAFGHIPYFSFILYILVLQNTTELYEKRQ